MKIHTVFSAFSTMPKDKKDKKSKDKKDKKSKGSKAALSTVPSDMSAAPTMATSMSMAPGAGPAFGGGQVFERYANEQGQLTPRGFMRMVQSEGMSMNGAMLNQGQMGRVPGTPDKTDFEVGRLFARFGKSGANGQITSNEFKEMMHSLAKEGRWQEQRSGGQQRAGNNMRSASTSYASTSAAAAAVAPPEHFFNLPLAPETERIRAEINAHASAVNPLAATELHMLQMNLLSKKEHLMQQMRFVRARAEEVQSVRRAIERETLADAEAIVHRLRGAESLKLSLLKHDMDQLQHDLDEIDGFAAIMKRDSNTAKSGTMNADGSALSTRSRYLEMCAEAERIANKNFKTTIDVQADDFDREVVERINLATQVEAAKEAAAVKDQMVWMLLQEREELKTTEKKYSEEVEKLSQESCKEIEEWVRLTDNFRAKLTAAQARIKELEGASRTTTLPEDSENSNGNAGSESEVNSSFVKGNSDQISVDGIGTPGKKGGWV